MIQSFPPKTILRSLKSIKVNVAVQGEGVVMMDKVLKQTIQGDLTNGGVEVVYGDNDDSDAVLFCRIVSTVSVNDYRGRPACYAFMLAFNLMTGLPGQPSDELFIIWNDAFLGCGDNGSLYNQLVSSARQLSFRLLSRLQES